MTENLIKSLFFWTFSETINGFALFLIKCIARKQVFRLLNRQFSLIRPHFRHGNAALPFAEWRGCSTVFILRGACRTGACDFGHLHGGAGLSVKLRKHYIPGTKSFNYRKAPGFLPMLSSSVGKRCIPWSLQLSFKFFDIKKATLWKNM